MSFGDLEGRPTKKRRFFVEDSPSDDATLTATPSLPDEIRVDSCVKSNATGSDSRSGSETNGNTEPAPDEAGTVSEGFDLNLFHSIVGENVSDHTIEKLRQICGDDIQRGMSVLSFCFASRLTRTKLLMPISTDRGRQSPRLLIGPALFPNPPW